MRPDVDLPGLDEIVLEESFVLGIRAEPGVVIFKMEYALTEKHPAYAPPPPSERECLRRGVLRFVAVETLVWDKQGAPVATDASGEPDYGHID